MTTIVLAAGTSSRMGINKLLLPYNGKTIIEETLSKVIAVSNKTIIVAGFEMEKLIPVVEKYNVKIVINEDYLSGQKSSTKKGVSAVDSDDFAIIPADLPLITNNDLRNTFSLLENYEVGRAFYNDTPAHPVVYRKENRARLLSWPGSMKEYLSLFNIGRYQGTIGTAYDVDTKERYKSLLRGDFNIPALN